jgi:uncharacterized RDD family membrane protein YckC
MPIVVGEREPLEDQLSTPEFPAEQPTSTPSDLASWPIRAGGYLIDFAPVLILDALFFRSASGSVFLSILSLGYLAYMGYLDGMTGQTPGKAIMGTRLVNQQGEVIGNGAGIGRKFLHIVDAIICGLGFLLPLVDSKRQTIADKIMTTFVVTGVERKPLSARLWMPPEA